MGLISAVTIVYNAESLVGYAIEAVLPYVDEYVIVNGSPQGPSTDLTKTVIDSFDSSKIKYFEGSFGNAASTDNWDIVQHNFAFEQCTGEWIWKVDADEIYDPRQISKVVSACKYDDGCDYMRWDNLYFVRDTSHIRYVPPPIRLWRDLPGYTFVDLSVTPICNGTPIHVATRGRWFTNVQTFHYGFLLPYRHQYPRIKKFIDREDNEDAQSRPQLYVDAHLRDAWKLDSQQVMHVDQTQPKAIRESMFYRRGSGWEGRSVGIYTTGNYNVRDGGGGSELSLCLAREAMIHRGVEVDTGPDLSDHYDIGIMFRELLPPETIDADIKIWWSCDQYPHSSIVDIVGGYDLIFAISDFHANYLVTEMHLPREKVKVINLGFDPEEYQGIRPKVPNQLIYCSQPDRGLKYLIDIFPRIKERVPDATLVVTCDKTLWGLSDAGNTSEKLALEKLPGVLFYGRVERSKLLALQQESDAMLFPCDYNELFCLSALECQAAGCMIVTHDIGALSETVVHGYTGLVIPTHPSTQAFQDTVVEQLCARLTTNRDELALMQKQARQRAFQFFTWDDILYEWTFYLDIIRRLKKLDW